MLKESKNGAFNYQKLSKEEMSKRGILGRLIGVCADFLNPTRNGRKYDEALWENVFNNDIMKEKIANRVCFGELGHPVDREEVDMDKVAICLAEQPVKGDDGKLHAIFDILDTPNGRILKSLCDYGSNIGISSRGTGDLYTDNDGNEAVDPDTYNCECFDAVLIPAVKEARLSYVTEALDNKRHNKTLKQKLMEELEHSTEEEKKIMNESLKSLGIQLNEESADFIKRDDITQALIYKVGDKYTTTYMSVTYSDKNLEELEKKLHDKWEADIKQLRNLDEDANFEEKVDEAFYVTDAHKAADAILNNQGVDKLELATKLLKSIADQGDSKSRDILADLCKEYGIESKDFGVNIMTPDEMEAQFGVRDLNDLDLNKYKIVENESINKDCTELHEGVDEYKALWNYRDSDIATSVLSLIRNDEVNAKEWVTAILAKMDEFNRKPVDESVKEDCSDKEEVEEKADNVGDLKELQESLLKIRSLEKDNLALQEKLSVCNAKEIKLKEELEKYKNSTINLSKNAKELKTIKNDYNSLKEEYNRINESLDRKGILIKNNRRSISELLRENKNNSELLKDSQTKIKALEVENKGLNEKLDSSNKVIKAYRAKIKSLKEDYIDAKAKAYNINKMDIMRKLNESYKLSDVDSICEELLDRRRSLSKLPFKITEDTKINATSSKNEYIKGGNNFYDDDDVSDSLLHLMNLK